MTERYSELFKNKEDFEQCRERLEREDKKLRTMNKNAFLLEIGSVGIFSLGAFGLYMLNHLAPPSETASKITEFVQNHHDIIKNVSMTGMGIGFIAKAADYIIKRKTDFVDKQFSQTLLVNNLRRIVSENEPTL